MGESFNSLTEVAMAREVIPMEVTPLLHHQLSSWSNGDVLAASGVPAGKHEQLLK